MMTQRRLDELKMQAVVRVREKLARFYAGYYGPRAIASAMQPTQPQMPPQMGPEMMGAPNGTNIYSQGG